MEMTESDLIKKAYRNRIKSLDNSISVFSLNIVMKKNTFKYRNHNIYFYGTTTCGAGYTTKPKIGLPGLPYFSPRPPSRTVMPMELRS